MALIIIFFNVFVFLNVFFHPSKKMSRCFCSHTFALLFCWVITLEPGFKALVRYHIVIVERTEYRRQQFWKIKITVGFLYIFGFILYKKPKLYVLLKNDFLEQNNKDCAWGAIYLKVRTASKLYVFWAVLPFSSLPKKYFCVLCIRRDRGIFKKKCHISIMV